MRKIRLSDTDFEFFDYEVSPGEFQFFQKHKDAFLCMWKDQGKPFWTKFTITFRSFTVKHGVIKQMSCDSPKFDNLVDQAFIYIHENYVDGKESMARGFIDDIAKLAQNHDKFPALDSKSFARDPFYIRETRELFRKFFGPPDEKASYLKVYILSPIYLRFGGSVCRCIKKWMDAPEIHPDDESYWIPPIGPLPTEHKVSVGIMCTPCLDACWDLFNKEQSKGHERGPKYLSCWTLGDPRFNDPKNPLYKPSADKSNDWRKELKFEDFRDFLHYAKFKYGTDSEKCQDCLLLANSRGEENGTECSLEKQKKKKKKKKNKKKLNEDDDINNTAEPTKETSTTGEVNNTDAKTKTSIDASTNFPSPKKEEFSKSEMQKGTESSSGMESNQTSGSTSFSPRKRRIVFSSRATITEDYKYGVMSTQDHRHPNSANSHLVLGFKTIITEEKGKIETKVVVSTLKNKDREIAYKREGMTVSTLLLNAEMIKAKVENLPYKMEWWEGNCFCICVLDYEREERAVCRKKKGKQYPTNFSIKVSNADDETCKKIMFKLLMYVGKRKKRESLGWAMTEEDVMTCVEAEDMVDHEGLTVTIMKGFRFEDRLSREEEKSLFQPGIVHRQENKKKVLMLLDCAAAVAVLKQEDGKRTLQELVESGETDFVDPGQRKEEFKVRIARMISNPKDFRILTQVDEDRVEEMQSLGLKLIHPEDKDKYTFKEAKEELLKSICTNCGWPVLNCICKKEKGSGKTDVADHESGGQKSIGGIDFEVFSKAIEEQTQKTENLFKFCAKEQSETVQKKSPKKTEKSRKKKDRINFFYQGPTKDGMTSVIEAEIVKVAELPPMPQGASAITGSSKEEWERVTRKIFEDVKKMEDNPDDEDVMITELDEKEKRAEKLEDDDSVKKNHSLENWDENVDENYKDIQNEKTEVENGNGEVSSEENDKEELNNEDEMDGVKHTSAESTVNGNLRHCANCDSVEPSLKTYKKCQKCKVEGISNARYYCGRECQVADWNARHKKEHKENLLT